MPVVVLGASGLVGTRAVAALVRVSPEVRAYVRRAEAAPSLRSLGAKVATGRIDDLDTLTTVMAGAHTVCHLVGGLDLPDGAAFEEANLTSTLRAVEAAAAAGVRRFLFLSYPGASPSSPNPYLRAKGAAEEAVARSGLEFVIVRATHVYGPGGAWLRAMAESARRRPALVVGSGRQMLAPVHVDDVAAVLAAADDRERVESGVWGLEGPDRVSADDLFDLLAGRSVRKLHVRPGVAAGLGPLVGRRTSRATLEVLAADSLADATDAAAEFGVARTPLREGLARSLD